MIEFFELSLDLWPPLRADETEAEYVARAEAEAPRVVTDDA